MSYENPNHEKQDNLNFKTSNNMQAPESKANMQSNYVSILPKVKSHS